MNYILYTYLNDAKYACDTILVQNGMIQMTENIQVGEIVGKLEGDVNKGDGVDTGLTSMYFPTNSTYIEQP